MNQNYSYGAVNSRCCCFGMRRAMRATTQLYDKYLEPAGIRATQFTLLVELSLTNAKTLTEIARNLVMDRTTLTRNLKPLQALGFISVVQSVDRRSKGYTLTESGKATLERSMPLWAKAQDLVEGNMGQDLYNSMYANVGKLVSLIESDKDKN